MGIRYGSVGVEATRIIPPAPAAGGPASPWTDVSLSASNLIQDPASIISSASYGPTTTVVLGSGDPGNIKGAVGPFTPDCPLWDWEIDSSFNYQTAGTVIVELSFTGTPNDGYLIYVGMYDGTLTGSGATKQHGIYASIQVQAGSTGTQFIAATPWNGDAADTVVANGGSLSIALGSDGDLNCLRDPLIRSTSNTGPAYGRVNSSRNPSGVWAGTNVRGFLAIGATASRTGGTFSDLKVRHVVLPML